MATKNPVGYRLSALGRASHFAPLLRPERARFAESRAASTVGDRWATADTRVQSQPRQRPQLGPERVMACLESAEVCEYVVHAGAELAEELGAPLFVVHVAPRPQSVGAEETGLQPALTMAERLGAGVVTIRASDRAVGLGAFARREGITHAVFGPEAQRGSSWRRSTLETFAKEQPGASTLVVRAPLPEPEGSGEGVPRVRHVVLDASAAQDGQSPWRRAFALATGGGVVGLSVAAILLLPAVVGFGLALAVALMWARWLEQERAS